MRMMACEPRARGVRIVASAVPYGISGRHANAGLHLMEHQFLHPKIGKLTDK